MTDDAPQITTLSDISANMFAAFILILIMVAAVAASRRAGGQASPQRTVTQRDLHLVKRAPLSPKAMVDMLYDRRPDAPGTSVDLLVSRIVISSRGLRESLKIGAGSEAALARAFGARIAAHPAPFRIYVFANTHYQAVAHVLVQDRIVWRELSVPRALRRKDGEGWLAAFGALARRSGDRAQFRTGLARILEAGETRSADFRTTLGGSDEEARARDMVARFFRTLRAALNGLTISLACGVVFLIERRTRRAENGDIDSLLKRPGPRS